MSPNLAFAPEGALMPNDRRTMLPLAAVIAVMCFLAALTLMAAVMISRAAADWNAGLATTATVQLMPGQGLELQSQAAAALDILRSTEGVAGAELMSLEETQALIEPWVGASDAIADLPMPRLITVRFAPGSTPDIANLAERIAKNVPGASLDTHIAWRDRLAVFAGVMSGLIYAVLLLITVAAVGAVVNATVMAVLLSMARAQTVAEGVAFGFLCGAGIAAATAFSQRILAGVPDAAADYLGFLRTGSSVYPLEAIRRAGVDLSTPAPVEAAFAGLAGLVDKLEALVGDRGTTDTGR